MLPCPVFTMTTQQRGKIPCRVCHHPGRGHWAFGCSNTKGSSGQACCGKLGLGPGHITKIALAKGKDQQCGVLVSKRKTFSVPGRQSCAWELLSPLLWVCYESHSTFGHVCVTGEGWFRVCSWDSGNANTESVPARVQLHWGSTASSARGTLHRP